MIFLNNRFHLYMGNYLNGIELEIILLPRKTIFIVHLNKIELEFSLILLYGHVLMKISRNMVVGENTRVTKYHDKKVIYLISIFIKMLKSRELN